MRTSKELKAWFEEIKELWYKLGDGFIKDVLELHDDYEKDTNRYLRR